MANSNYPSIGKKLFFIVSVVFALSGCLQDRSESHTGEAEIRIQLAKPDNANTLRSRAFDNTDTQIPDEITDIIITLSHLSGEVVDSITLSSINDVVGFQVSSGKTYSITGEGIAGEETLFRGSQLIFGLKPSEKRNVGLSMLVIPQTKMEVGGSQKPIDSVIDISTEQAVNFSPDISGLKNTAVSWYINNIPGGNETIGTIDENGTYTPPLTLPENTSISIKMVPESAPSFFQEKTIELIGSINPEPTDSVQTETNAIRKLAGDFPALFASTLPEENQVSSFLASDFIDEEKNKSEMLAYLTTDLSLIGLSFTDVAIEALDVSAGTATISFSVSLIGVSEQFQNTWELKKNEGLWQFRGNRVIVDLKNTFYCGQHKTSSGFIGKSCGLLVFITDNSATDNPGNALVDSARITLLRAGEPVPGIELFMGVPDLIGTPGELLMYKKLEYSNSYMVFGTGQFELDQALIREGDMIQIELFTEALDISDSNNPVINGSPVATYQRPVTAIPEANAESASYPTADEITLTALDTYAGGDLFVSWQLPAGMVNSSIELSVCVRENCVNIEERAFATSTSTVLNLDTSSLDLTSLAYNIELSLRAIDSNGQLFVMVYHVEAGSVAQSSDSFEINSQILLENGGDPYISTSFIPGSNATSLFVLSNKVGETYNSTYSFTIDGVEFAPQGSYSTFDDTPLQVYFSESGEVFVPVSDVVSTLSFDNNALAGEIASGSYNVTLCSIANLNLDNTCAVATVNYAGIFSVRRDL